MINKVRKPHPVPAEHKIGHPVPHHPGHRTRHNVLNVVYDNEKMKEVYGDIWPYHLEKISAEPPEMKMLFALQMGFKVSVNTVILEHMKNLYKEESSYKFSNPALDPSYNALATVASRLDISEEDASIILGFAPDGVLSIVISTAKILAAEKKNSESKAGSVE